MSLKEQFIAEVERKIIGPRELKDRLIGDLQAHFVEGAESGESEATVIRKLGSSDDIATEFMANIRLNYAGFWIRFVAHIIDMMIILIPAAIIFGLIFIISVSTSASVTVDPQVIANHPAAAPLIIILIIVFSIFMGAIGILYFPVLEGLYGQTLGKRLLGLRVVREGGIAIGLKEAFLRRISLYLKILPIDALFIPFNEKKQRAFDMVAKTVVIYDNRTVPTDP